MSETDIQPATELTSTDHWIIGAALYDLGYKLDGEPAGKLLSGRIDELRAQFMAVANLPAHPRHIRIDETEFLKMMTALADCDTWHIFWEKDQETSENVYDLTAEIWNKDGRDSRFALASGLIGAGAFQTLAEKDATFARAVEGYVLERGPKSMGAQIRNEIIEIPVEWSVIADDASTNVIEDYIQNVIAEPSDIGGYGVLASLVDIHSNEDLAQADYAGVHAVVTGLAEDLERLHPMLDLFEARVLAGSGSKLKR